MHISYRSRVTDALVFSSAHASGYVCRISYALHLLLISISQSLHRRRGNWMLKIFREFVRGSRKLPFAHLQVCRSLC